MKHNRIFIIPSIFAIMFTILWIGQTTLINAANLETREIVISQPLLGIPAINGRLQQSTAVVSNTLIVGELTKLIASDRAIGDRYGQSVAIDGTTAVVSAIDEDERGIDAGAVYVLTRTGNNWSEETKLLASDGAAYDAFGFRVAVSGDRVVVGARLEDEQGIDAGAVYVYTRDGNSWTETKLLASDGAAYDEFGFGVAIEGDYLVVGAPGDDDHGSRSGSAYVFMWDGNSWIEQAKLSVNEVGANANFGVTVAIEGNRVVAGAYTYQAGAVYTFVRNGASWIQEARLQADDGDVGDNFGHGLAVSEDMIVVGAYHDDAPLNNSGSAYIFTFNGTIWEQQTKLVASDSRAGATFGHDVNLRNGVIIIGAMMDSQLGTQSGATYVYTFNGQQWVERKLLASDGNASDQFSTDTAIDDNYILIGSRYKETPGGVTGAAYMFEYHKTMMNIYDPSTNLLPNEACPTWARFETGEPVEPIIANDQLIISTTQDTDNLSYVQTGITITYPLIVEGRVRRVSGSSSHPARAPIALGVTTEPEVGNTLYIGEDEIFILDGYLSVGDSAIVDTDDDFHNYRIEVDAVGNIQVFYDDVLTLSGTTFTSGATHGSVPRIIWGELSSLSNGVSEWERVAHNSIRPCITDVSMNKTVSSVTAVPNQPITYTLAYTNHGPDVAYNTLITDIVPIHLENLSISSSGPQITATGVTSYSWNVAPLAVNESGIITITGIIRPELTVDTLITNTAVISNSFDITPTNNVDTAVVQVIATQYVYLPIILKPAPKSFPVKIGDPVPSAPTEPGATFFTATVALPDTIPTTGQFFLSSQPDHLTTVQVDDELAITLDGNELFTHSFSPGCQPVQAELVELPRTVVEQLTGETPTFSYRDACGDFVSATEIWIIWIP